VTSPSIQAGAGKGAALREAKRALRDRVLRERDALPAEARARASAAILARIEAREDFRAARTVLLSVAFRSEWETRPLVEAALALGKIVGAPRVDRARRMLEPCAITGLGSDLGPGFLGIHEPLPHCRRKLPG